MYDFTSTLFVYKFVYLLQIIAGIAAFSFYLKKQDKFLLKLLLSVFISVAVCAALPLIDNSPVYISGVFILLLCVCFGCMFLCFEHSWQSFLYIVLNIYCLQHMSYELGLMIATISGLSKKSVYEIVPFTIGDFYSIMISLGFYIFALMIMMIFVASRKEKKNFDPSVKNFKAMIFGVVLILFNITLNAFITQDLLLEFRIKTLIFTVIYDVLCSLCVIGLLYSSSVNHSLTEEIKEINIIRAKDKEIYKVKKENNEAMQIICHDLKNRINAMQNDSKEIEQVKSTLAVFENTFYTNNATLDIILSEYGLRCKNENIALICNVDGSLVSFMEEVDLYSLFDNALSNAFTAASKVNTKEDRYILLNIHKKGKMTIITFENKYSQDLIVNNGVLSTTKSNKMVHGFGVKSMTHIVEKYEGDLRIETKNNTFKLNIIFF